MLLLHHGQRGLLAINLLVVDILPSNVLEDAADKVLVSRVAADLSRNVHVFDTINPSNLLQSRYSKLNGARAVQEPEQVVVLRVNVDKPARDDALHGAPHQR